MSHHIATVAWTRDDAVFTDNQYSRGHVWRFDGGTEVAASSSPANVRLPFSIEANVDPEEAYVAALSSCHMLWFLNLAALKGFCVDSYTDAAEGTAAKLPDGRDWVPVVVLRPQVVFSGKPITAAEVDDLHHRAHHACHLANSVKTEIRTEGTWRHAG